MKRIIAVSRWATMLCLLWSVSTPNLAETLVYKKSFAKVIDTGLRNTNEGVSPPSAAIWIDDHRLIARRPMKRNAQSSIEMGNIEIYDLNTGQTREVMRQATPICWDMPSGRAIVYYYPNANDPENLKLTLAKRPKQLFSVQVNAEGNIKSQAEVSSVLGQSLIWDEGCLFQATRPPELKNRIIATLRPEHGYIDMGERGKPGDKPIVFVRTDGKRMELKLARDDIAWHTYLPFLGQYQLRENSCYDKSRKCPPDIHLLSPSGKLTVLPTPFGEEVLRHVFISSVRVVKNGLLITSSTRGKLKDGYFLLRDGVLHHLWEPRSSLYTDLGREDWGIGVVSPDGCKLAFHRRETRRGANFINVIDLCSAGN